jgi:hypothetical protein
MTQRWFNASSLSHNAKREPATAHFDRSFKLLSMSLPNGYNWLVDENALELAPDPARKARRPVP